MKLLSPVRLFATPWTVAYQAPLSMGFSRQEYWSGVPLPSLGDIPNLGIKPRSPTLQADILLSEPPGKPWKHELFVNFGNYSLVGYTVYKYFLSSCGLSFRFIYSFLCSARGFPGSSAGKESACNAGEPQFHSWVRRKPWKRDRLSTPVLLGFLVAQTVRNLPAMWETWV